MPPSSSNHTPSVQERFQAAKARAAEAVAASEKRRRLGEEEDAARFASPPVGAGAQPAPADGASEDGGATAAASVNSSVNSPPVETAPGLAAPAVTPAVTSCCSKAVDGFILDLDDELTQKMLDGKTKQGNVDALRSLLKLLGAGDWPLEKPEELPDRANCLAYILRFRGAATVTWSEESKSFTVDGLIPSPLNEPTRWSTSGNAVAAPSGDLNVSGGATSTAPVH